MPVTNPQTLKIDVKKASEMWGMGYSAAKIAKAFDVTKNVIIGFATRNRDLFPAKNEVEKDDGSAKEKVNLEEAKSLWADGMQISRMAIYFGIRKSSLQHMITEDRVSFPKRNRGGNNVSGSTPKQRVERVKRERDEFVSKLNFITPLNTYDTARIPQAKLLIDLQKRECKWPLGDGRPFVFCAAHAQKGAYCPHHTVRSMPRVA